jgi:hypothetical protein
MAVYSANTFYEYTNQRLGSFSGGVWTSALGNAPHPVAITNKYSASGDTVIDFSSITLGGFNGLNN